MKVKLYRVPGYGPAYRAWSRWIHRHNRCVLTRRGPMEDGAWLWRCHWCGNRVREEATDRRNP